MKIEVSNLTKVYDKPVLDELNFSDDIKTLALIGRSGCGKSTFLRILAGLESLTSGTVHVDNTPVSDSSQYRRNIGFVFQQAGLFSHLTALDNIRLPLERVHKMPKEDAIKRSYELLERFGLTYEAVKYPSELSGGQKQRISIARAVAPKPKILFLDEPTSALDPEFTTEVLNMVSELEDENLALIIATHEMGFALHSCEKAMYMDEGKIIEYDKSEVLFKTPKNESLKNFLNNTLQWKL